MRDMLPRLILTVVGALLVLTPFVSRPAGVDAHPLSRFFAYVDENFSVWFNVLASFAFLLGALSLLRTHGRKVLARRKDWLYSLLTLVSFVGVLVIGMLKLGGPPGLAGDVAHPDSWLKSTLYSLLAFFVASAAYRAFRLHSLEAGLLLAAALIVLLGQTPFGVAMTAWFPEPLDFLRIDHLSAWLLRVPNTAGWRAILIGIALGIVSMSLRLILGLERGALGEVRR
jgi:hypothetical protein